MKIKLALLDQDEGYLNRIDSTFAVKYPGNIEIYLFTDPLAAQSSLKESKIDMFIASSLFEIDPQKIPRRCAFAYFVETPDVIAFKEFPAICKYQKAEAIYKSILEIYAEYAPDDGILLGGGGSNTRVITFMSAGGGMGVTALSAAFAARCAIKNIPVLYLNLERFSSMDAFYSGAGSIDLSDIIFAIKTKRPNLALKLKSTVRRDSKGVHFISPPKSALDIMELNATDIENFISALVSCRDFSAIAVDTNFVLDKFHLELVKASHTIVLVTDGSYASNARLVKLCSAMDMLGKTEELAIPRMVLFYNKFTHESRTIESLEIPSIGTVSLYNHLSFSDVVSRLKNMEVLDKI